MLIFREGCRTSLSQLPDGVICASGGGAKNGPVAALSIDDTSDEIVVLAGSYDDNPDVLWDISAHACIDSPDSSSAQGNVYVVLNSSQGIENKISAFNVSRKSAEPIVATVWDAPLSVLAISCSPDGGKMLVICERRTSRRAHEWITRAALCVVHCVIDTSFAHFPFSLPFNLT